MLDNKSNILIINDFAHIDGGASHVAISSAIALAEQGYLVTYFAAVTPVSQEFERAKIDVICTNQFEIAKDPNRLRASFQGLWNFKAANRLKKLLQEYDPANTVIHIHSWTKALSSSTIRLAFRMKFKVVVTLHDYFSVCPNGGFFNYQDARICNLRPLTPACLLSNCDSRNYSQKLWRVGRQMIQHKFGMLPAQIDNYIAVSNFSRVILQPHISNNANIYHVENPVSATQERPADICSDSPFVFVGRLAKEKGPDVLAKAASGLNSNIVFVGAGDGYSEIKEIYPAAEITGWLSADGVRDRLRSARALIFPSLWYETLGLVVLEAAALGIPTIVSDAAAARDLVADGITGSWFKSGDVEDLKEKMNVLQDAKTAKRMGLAAYERYWSNPYTMQRHTKQLLDAYRKVLES
jgi:glycosyltransferase involved in cell wall biosynthesis